MMKNMMKKVNAILVAGALMLSAAGAYSAFMATTDTKVNNFNIVEGGG